MANEGHDVADLRELIREVAREVIPLEERKAEIQAKITKVKAPLKARGIAMAQFNVALRFYKLQGNERIDILDTLYICFEALDIDGQGDLFREPESSTAEIGGTGSVGRGVVDTPAPAPA